MEKKKYKKYQASRESNPAFILNQIGKIAFNRANDGEKFQQLEIITAQLMCALTMEAVLNYLGKKIFENWQETERSLKPQEKLKKIAKYCGLEKDLGSRPFQYFPDIFRFRDNLVHAKPSEHFAQHIQENKIGENGFPIIEDIAELSTDWEKFCNIDTVGKWRKAVSGMSSKLSEAAQCQDPLQVGDIIDTWSETEI